jgi:hypothetical protein
MPGPKHKNGRTALPFAIKKATVGIEPTVRVLQTLALPLGDVAACSGKASIPKHAELGKTLPRVTFRF